MGEAEERVRLERRVVDLEAEVGRWRQTAENLGQLAENVEQAFWLLDVARDALLYVNEAAEHIWGRSRDELLDDATALLDAVHPDDRARVERAQSRQLAGKSTVEDFRVVRPDGSVRWVVDRAIPIRDELGRVVRVCGVTTDITERVEERRTRERLFAAIEAADDGIAILGPDETFTYVNRAHLRIYGYDDEGELLGEGWHVLYADAQRRAFETEHVPELRRTGGWRGESVGRRRDGSLFEQEVSLRLLEGGGLVCICRDVTHRNRSTRVVQHAQKLESLGVLASGIAHDFNNLLTGVLGNADLALRRVAAEAPALEPHLEAIVVAAERAAELCDQLLAYAGRGAIRPGPVDLGRLVREMDPLLGVSVAHQAELVYEVVDGLPKVEADASQIRQVVMNLVTNAAEASRGTDAVVLLRTGTEELEGAARQVFVEVEDRGCGMDSVVVERMFDPFFSTKVAGRGLGLAAVGGIVQAHGGELRVDSVPGRGTRIRVLFPERAGPVANAPVPDPSRVAVDDGWRAHGTVLVIDDEPLALGVARAALERRGFDVEVAHSGADGVERFARLGERIVLVLLDLTMPGMDGAQTLAALREAGSRAPVILSSGWDERSAAERVAGVVAAGFLRKPYGIARLDEVVRAALARTPGSGGPVSRLRRG